MSKKNKSFYQVLPCSLMGDELLTKGDKLATISQEIGRLEAEKSETAKTFKDQIEDLEADRNKLAREIKNKAEDREVECIERFIYDKREVITVRLDTGETIATRAMKPHEYQEEMDLHAKPVTT